MGRSHQIRYQRVYLTWVVHSKLGIYVCTKHGSFTANYVSTCVANMARSQQSKYLRVYTRRYLIRCERPMFGTHVDT
jgi:hypothetical protein